MVLTQETISYIIGLTVLANVGLTVYNSLRKPQEDGEKRDAIFNERFCNLKDTVVNLRDNHLHTVETKLDKHIQDNQDYIQSDIKWKSKMETLLDERLPKK